MSWIERGAWGALVVLLIAGSGFARDEPDSGADAAVTFPMPQTVVRQDQTQVISFELAEPASKDRTLSAKVSPDDRLEVIREPQVLSGRRLGFVRVRGLAAGEAELTIGDATLPVHVSSQTSTGAPDALDHRPVIVTPVNGAHVWERVTVGVELARGQSPEAVDLDLPEGAKLVDRWASELDQGWPRRAAFTIDLAKVEAGPARIALQAGEEDTASDHREAVVHVHVVQPEDDALQRVEAEAVAEGEHRPERYGEKTAAVHEDEKASGKQYVSHAGARPPTAFAVEVEKGGWYQLMVQARGDFAGGAWPTVGFRVDDENRPRTTGRLMGDGWQRIAVGRPVHLDAGEHSVVVYYENDFYAGRLGDRNLDLDRCELLPVDGPAVPSEPVSTDPLGDYEALIATERNLHHQTLAGDQQITARIWMQDTEQANPPTVTLRLNDEPVAKQRAWRAVFSLDRGYFRDGENTLKLEARAPDGRVARSVAQRFTMLPLEHEPAPAREVRRFSVRDPRWDAKVTERAETHASTQRSHVNWASNTASLLELPESLTGSFNVEVEGEGDVYEGPPIATVTLLVDDEETPVGEAEVQRRWATYAAGEVDLPEGPKRVRVAFENDKYDGSEEKDRNLRLGGLRFIEARERGEDHPPTVTLRYPEADSDVYEADAVVAQLNDDRGIAWAELLLDGERTGIRLNPAPGEATVVLPLSLTHVTAGAHDLTVRVRDEAGEVVTSEPRTVNVLAEPPSQPTRYHRALRLLNRFAYGPEPRPLAAVLTMGERAYLEQQLAAGMGPGVVNSWSWAMLVRPGALSRYLVTRRAFEQLLTTPNPVRARWRMFVSNHFTTWLRKTGPTRKAREEARFARLGFAPFDRLLQASATSPAMLRYLDQGRSFAGRLNENYARELMELHTVGVDGGYTQEDVEALARLMTGWTYAEVGARNGTGVRATSSVFRYAPALGADTSEQVFGLQFEKQSPAKRGQRVELMLEMLAAHPATARHLAEKLIAHYVVSPAPQPIVERIAERFMVSGGDMREVLLALAEIEVPSDDDAARHENPRMAKPLTFGVRLARITGSRSAHAVLRFCDMSGFGLFDCEMPDGYPAEDIAYTDSNAMLQRWHLTDQFSWRLYQLLPATLRRSPEEESEVAAWRERVVDALAVRLTGRPLGARSRTAVMDALEATDLSGGQRIRMIATLIGQMPESNLR